MKKNDFVQIKGLDPKELNLKVKVIRMEIANLVMDKNMKKMKDLKTIFKKRKDLARVLTVLKQKQLLEELTSKVENKEKTVVVDNSAKKPELKKKGRIQLSKNKI